MASSRTLLFLLTIVIAAAFAHLAWSTAMAWRLSSSYTHRIVDVRRWPGDVSPERATEFVSMFLAQAKTPEAPPATVFFGSSVTFGFPWREEVTFPARYAAQRPRQRVLNASVIGADLAYTDSAILCGATNAGLHADTAIVELQVVLGANNITRAVFRGLPPLPPCDERIGSVGYWPFVMRHPLAAGWLPFIWNDKASVEPDRDMAPAAANAGYFVGRHDFAVIEARFRQQVTAVLARARTIARRVYAFPSPVFLPGVREAGYDSVTVYWQLTAALEACRSVPGVVCLDPEAFYTARERYWNLTHFNQRGHQAFANWLVREIDRSR